VVITNYKDFERNFGGLSLDSPVSYAVADFFRNGGSQAVIVRQYHLPTVSGNTVPGVGMFVLSSGLSLCAVSPGTWANNVTVSVDTTGCTGAASTEIAGNLGVSTADLFNISITENATTGSTITRYVNLTVKDTPNRIDRVLAQQSKTLMLAPPAAGTTFTWPTTPPPNTTTPISATTGTALDSAPLDQTDYATSPLDKTDTINLVCIPPDVPNVDNLAVTQVVYANVLTYCVTRRAMLIVDPPVAWGGQAASAIQLSDLGVSGIPARNAVTYHPRINQSNPLRAGLVEQFPACGVIAGIIARTDGQRGVWKAPAGLDASVLGVDSLAVKLSDSDSGFLNPQGINCLRDFPAAGHVIWGARTLRGADALGDDYKYLSVRRLALYIEESVYRGTRWAVFEPNDQPLWTQIRMSIGSFMQSLFRQGAFQGQTPAAAYFVQCDSSTTTAADISAGRVNILVGFAPLKPAEFVVISFQQMAGQTSA
jgi:phage tail sheath protein FI